MSSTSTNFLKNYFLEKMISTRLYLLKNRGEVTDFFDKIRSVNKLLVIIPRDRAEEVYARQFVTRIHEVFEPAKFSTLDVCSIRKSDANWLGVPKNAFLTKLQDEEFDLVIDVNSHHDHLCTFLGVFTNAPLRMHVTEGKFDKFYNIHIRSEPSTRTEIRFKNMINYLAKIRKMSKLKAS
jgi:hypothetical protein